METLEHSVTPDIKQNLMTTVPPDADVISQNDASYIWLPFVALLVIIALSALVTYMARNRRKFMHYYCQRKYRHNLNDFSYIDDEDSDVSIARGDDYGEDNATECLLKGKLQINNHRENYQATQVTHLATANSDGNSVLRA